MERETEETGRQRESLNNILTEMRKKEKRNQSIPSLEEYWHRPGEDVGEEIQAPESS